MNRIGTIMLIYSLIWKCRFRKQLWSKTSRNCWGSKAKSMVWISFKI